MGQTEALASTSLYYRARANRFCWAGLVLQDGISNGINFLRINLPILPTAIARSALAEPIATPIIPSLLATENCCLMSLHPQPPSQIPADTVRVALAAFPKGNSPVPGKKDLISINNQLLPSDLRRLIVTVVHFVPIVPEIKAESEL